MKKMQKTALYNEFEEVHYNEINRTSCVWRTKEKKSLLLVILLPSFKNSIFISLDPFRTVGALIWMKRITKLVSDNVTEWMSTSRKDTSNGCTRYIGKNKYWKVRTKFASSTKNDTSISVLNGGIASRSCRRKSSSIQHMLQ